MGYRFSNDAKDIKEVYFGVMVCPKCGYKTVSTNVCRTCQKMMVYTGKISRTNPEGGRKQTRRFIPKDSDELFRLIIGHGVVFE